MEIFINQLHLFEKSKDKSFSSKQIDRVLVKNDKKILYINHLKTVIDFINVHSINFFILIETQTNVNLQSNQSNLSNLSIVNYFVCFNLFNYQDPQVNLLNYYWDELNSKIEATKLNIQLLYKLHEQIMTFLIDDLICELATKQNRNKEITIKIREIIQHIEFILKLFNEIKKLCIKLNIIVNVTYLDSENSFDCFDWNDLHLLKKLVTKEVSY